MFNKKKLFIFVSILAVSGSGIAKNIVKNSYPFEQVPFTSVKISQNSFWGNRIKAVRDVTIPLAFSKCETEGRYDNFVKAAHPDEKYDVSTFMGFPFDDTDVYKTIEGASYVLQTFPDKKLVEYIDSVLDIVAAAQEPDGYLYTARTINPQKPHRWSGSKRWESEEVLSHELYNLGHMVDAACAHYQATGSTKFLDIAKRYADCVVREVGPGKNQACVVPGHQIAEMALARLYSLTGDKRYLDEAKFFLDYRGKTNIKNSYSQSQVPVIEQNEAVGHAVRAGYMYSGMADVAALTGDSAYIKAIDAIWNNIVNKKYYLTGGVGALHNGEAFGANYELPNLTAYNETCAAIAMVYFNQRMFMLHGDSKYIDCLERTLYNGVISGMSIDGGKFFYPNPLASDGKYKFNADNTIERQPWFGCACCPSNLCRFIPSVPGYMYAVKDNSVYVNLFSDNTSTISVGKGKVVLREKTMYPWNGDVRIDVVSNSAGKFNMKIRIPGWLRNKVVPSDLYFYDDSIKLNYSVSVNGKKVDGQIDNGYLTIDRKWKKGDNIDIHFDMKPRLVKANANVYDDYGRVAVERGPLVYCAEWADNDFDVFHFILNKNTAFTVNDKPKLLGGIKEVTANGLVFTTDDNGKVSVDNKIITLIPYYAWCHRGPGKMIVWMASGLEVMDEHR
ncbi:glycoside hydrolase family 127 protein [uncultured Prevotella sp.]|uniref:glycoside hydrolase family 127 protein n=1 Tax=uncultured Prevotella sp. TaxID=159272 RepID=UPI0025E7A0B9|nr:glycoside hydrolase family 127 protein [uncultured Prevotella sp.]